MNIEFCPIKIKAFFFGLCFVDFLVIFLNLCSSIHHCCLFSSFLVRVKNHRLGILYPIFNKNRNKSFQRFWKIKTQYYEKVRFWRLLKHTHRRVRNFCQYMKSDAGKGKCRRFQERPHLWTVNHESKQYWTSGMFDERVLFPELPLQQIPSYEESQCKDRICVEKSIKSSPMKETLVVSGLLVMFYLSI